MNRPAHIGTAATGRGVRVAMAPRRMWRILLAAFGLLLLAAVAVWLTALGHPQRALHAAAVWSAGAGLSVRQVVLEGDRRQPRLAIYREILSGGTDAMMLLDLPDLRARIEALPWVKEAQVQRRWPDTLVVTIVEREPIAIWQSGGRHRLIDGEGQVLPEVPLADFAGLPLLVGEGAREEARALLHLLGDHPALREALVAATRVGGRRWDLRLASGETLMLPEDGDAAAALRGLRAAAAEQPLLGQGFLRIDLRIPGRMTVRVSKDADEEAKKRAAAAAAAGKRQAAGPGLAEGRGLAQGRAGFRLTAASMRTRAGDEGVMI